MTILILALFFIDYQKELQNLDRELLSHMSLCSFTLNCREFGIDFIPKGDNNLTFHLYKNRSEVYSLYPIKKAGDFFIKIYIDSKEYNNRVFELKKSLAIYFLITLMFVLVLSTLFSLYSLYPLREALLLTREFIKDILHDVNTPMATMRLNLALLKKEIGENKKVSRIERGIEKLLLLQENLKHYLLNHKMEAEVIDLRKICLERVEMIEKNYPDINCRVDIPQNIILNKNRDALIRVLDNIIDNAFKYNRRGGSVDISYSDGKLKISDTGVGIRDTKRAFDRFYKESLIGGMGIGLDIVKKLSKELNIDISIKSIPDVGTTIYLKIN